MKIVIAGPGAIGSLFAAYLAKSRQEILLLDKDKARAQGLNESGISVRGVSGTWQARVRVSADPAEAAGADIFLVCVKSYDTRQLINYARPAMGRGCSILTLQNGIGNVEIIKRMLPGQGVFAGVTSQGANLAQPGKIRHAGFGETIIGGLQGKVTSRLR